MCGDIQVYDAFADLVAAKVAALRVGDGLSSDTTHGPLITPAGVEKVSRDTLTSCWLSLLRLKDSLTACCMHAGTGS